MVLQLLLPQQPPSGEEVAALAGVRLEQLLPRSHRLEGLVVELLGLLLAVDLAPRRPPREPLVPLKIALVGGLVGVPSGNSRSNNRSNSRRLVVLVGVPSGSRRSRTTCIKYHVCS